MEYDEMARRLAAEMNTDNFGLDGGSLPADLASEVQADELRLYEEGAELLKRAWTDENNRLPGIEPAAATKLREAIHEQGSSFVLSVLGAIAACLRSALLHSGRGNESLGQIEALETDPYFEV